MAWSMWVCAAIVSPFPFYWALWNYPQRWVRWRGLHADPCRRMALVSHFLKLVQFAALFSVSTFAWPPFFCCLLIALGLFLNFRVTSLRHAWLSRWDWFHRPIHAVAHILHPLWRDEKQVLCEELEDGWTEYINNLTGGDVQQIRILEQERLQLRNSTGKHFGSPTAHLRECQLEPVSWWEKYGIGAPLLRSIAMRVLSQDCSSGPCERNWSTWALFHTKKRNKLGTRQLERLVYCHNNLRLLEEKGNPIEPRQVNVDLLDIEKVKDIPEIPPEEKDIYAMLYKESLQPIRTTRSRSRVTARVRATTTPSATRGGAPASTSRRAVAAATEAEEASLSDSDDSSTYTIASEDESSHASASDLEMDHE